MALIKKLTNTFRHKQKPETPSQGKDKNVRQTNNATSQIEDDKKVKSIQPHKQEKGNKEIPRALLHYAHILERPHITEKATHLSGMHKFIFDVRENANKREISSSIQAIFSVKPIKVNIVHTKGKVVRFQKITGQRKHRKKAIVTLPKGKTLDIYEGV